MGTGGTCWAGSDALYTLLNSLGFKVYRGIATMLITPNLPPNHGTVIVSIDDRFALVDTSVLHGIPLCIDIERTERIEHSAWGIVGEGHKDK